MISEFIAILKIDSLTMSAPVTQQTFDRSESALTDDCDQQGRSYRYLLSIYTQNINSFLKNHQNCLGDMQYYPKIKSSTQDQRSFSRNIYKIWKKQGYKLVARTVSRNQLTKNTCLLFAKKYRSAQEGSECAMINSGDLTTQQPEQVVPTVNNFTSCFSYRKNIQPASYSSERPTSSKRLTKRIKEDHLQVSQIFQNLQRDATSIPLKMKTISVSEDPRTKKQQYFLGNINRQKSNTSKGHWRVERPKDDEEQEFIFQGNEIMIKERRKIRPEQIKNPRMTTSVKFWNNRATSIRQSHLNQAESNQNSKLQRKIMMTNSSLAVNPSQMQGYAPKSRISFN